ncbi:MAG TPA: hypothetical protein VNA19_16790 [Pyrinomonadaceae bacterium]|jgi:hypothetical protein|nr:hypothetical protein [Pyrinomonadaceae bacterium]
MLKRVSWLVLLLALVQPACVVAGYSNRGGWFFWPGGLGLVVLLAVVVIYLLSRRRR